MVFYTSRNNGTSKLPRPPRDYIFSQMFSKKKQLPLRYFERTHGFRFASRQNKSYNLVNIGI